jgi:hypothetical protein
MTLAAMPRRGPNRLSEIPQPSTGFLICCALAVAFAVSAVLFTYYIRH